MVGVPAIVDALGKAETSMSYGDVKGGALLEERRRVKEDVRGVLEGWVKNGGDDGFELEQ